MLDKIKISLWDIFTFFLTGMMAFLIGCAFFIAYGHLSLAELFRIIEQLPTPFATIVIPFALTLLGLIFEPFANYLERTINIMVALQDWLCKIICLDKVFAIIPSRKSKKSEETAILIDEIKSNYLGQLNGKIKNPYALCKEYVETKQLSTTFMVFLSRYGFYRNCSALSYFSGVACLLLGSNPVHSFWNYFLPLTIIAIIFKHRADEFYSYMAPTVYRAFLIDKIQWTPACGAANLVEGDNPTGVNAAQNAPHIRGT
jgi:hypothetical protein